MIGMSSIHEPIEPVKPDHYLKVGDKVWLPAVFRRQSEGIVRRFSTSNTTAVEVAVFVNEWHAYFTWYSAKQLTPIPWSEETS